ncbi:MAG: polysaccharide pyruvyl transferase family protein, partial [Roseovarius sp.]|nr:polysaccharide pyruvyl transferase family protein [Roseovarius sp.]
MPKERPLRLAIFGTFDVENYGDLLFPLIAKQRLGPLGIEVVAISPTAHVTRYRDAVLPLSYPAFVRDVDSFDAVLIGGGNIVHTKDFELPDYSATAYAALWIGATAQAVRQGLPVIWNGPGVLQQRVDRQAPEWLKRTVDAADRFVVRDNDSAKGLELWSGRRPSVIPDTALDLARLWPLALVKDRFRD